MSIVVRAKISGQMESGLTLTNKWVRYLPQCFRRLKLNFHNSRCIQTHKPHIPSTPALAGKYSVSFFTGLLAWQVNRLSFLFLPPLVVFILFVEKYFDTVLVCRTFALWKKGVVTITAEVEFPFAKGIGAQNFFKKSFSHPIHPIYWVCRLRVWRSNSLYNIEAYKMKIHLSFHPQAPANFPAENINFSCIALCMTLVFS